MNWAEIKSDWQVHAKTIGARWNRLRNEDLDAIAGDRNRLLQSIQHAYGIAAEEAQRQIRAWERSHEDSSGTGTVASAVGEEAEARAQAAQPAPESGGGSKLHGDKLSQPGYLDDEARNSMRESVRPGEAVPQRPSGEAPSQTKRNETSARAPKARHRRG